MKYMVITKKWDDKKKAVVNYVCGEFPEYWLASMFAKEYKEHFATDTKVVDKDEAVQAFI